MSLADAIIAVSESVRNHYPLCERKRPIHVIYNGIAWKADFEHFYDEALSRPNVGHHHYTFASIGLLHPSKGHDQAIKALSIVAKHYPQVRLLLVGGGSVEKLKCLVNELDLHNNVVFLGYIHDPFQVYRSVDGVLVCSANEAMGRVAVEAMAMGIPVIGRLGGGTAEIIDHDETGILYSGKVEDLAECMISLIENPAKARLLGMEGWLVAKDKFSIETYTQQVLEVIKSVEKKCSDKDFSHRFIKCIKEDVANSPSL
jgi:glycosyltransferase involved in cell wall biosynthesis